MKIEFSDEQLAMLKELLDEAAEASYQDMFECKKIAVDAEEEFVKKEYNALADAEEERFGRIKALVEYVRKYEDLMRNA